MPRRRAVLLLVMKVAAPVTATHQCLLFGNATGALQQGHTEASISAGVCTYFR